MHIIFPDHMHEPFEAPIRVKPGRGLPAEICTPAEAWCALDGWVPDALHWTLAAAGLTVMRREGRELPHMRWMLASALELDGLLVGA